MKAGTLPALAVVLLLVFAQSALAAPRPGERYDGKSGTGQRIFLTVSADGGRLDSYALYAGSRCSDGRRRFFGLNDSGEAPVMIDAAGSFSYSSKAQRLVLGDVTGRSKTTFSGTFDAAGDSVSGTIQSNFRSDSFDCDSGPVPYTIHRDGTPQAPFSDSVMTTGRYAASGRGIRLNFRTLAPARLMVRGEIDWTARCRTGRTLNLKSTYRSYLLTDGGRVTDRDRDRVRLPKDNVTVILRMRLTVSFFMSGDYDVSGRWRVRAQVRRAGRRIDTCRMNRPFSGSFAP